MRLSLSPLLPLRFMSLLLFGTVFPQQLHAQTVQAEDYIYIGIEAEDHVIKNDRWVLTTPSTPTEENDPDGNHSDQASGSTYLELLPDIRVTHEDEFGPPTAYWGRGGQGPDADYAVNFPEPGRYYVHVRAYSTGTEDNGLHVGINGSWPESGQRMQFCTAARRAWWWSSAQRDAGGNGSCGTEKTIWLDVPSAGLHTVSISAREDGFEIDRLALIKDLSDNTRICEPTNIDGVNCRNGSIESADGFVDLRVRLETSVDGADPEVEQPNPVEIEQAGEISLTARIENLDAFDTATDIVLTLSPVDGDWYIIEMDDRCSEIDDVFKCTLDDLHPTAPNENAPFEFTLQAIVAGDLRIDAAVFSAEVDDSPANDVAATVVRVLPGEAPLPRSSDVALIMDTDKSEYETGDTVELTAIISNDGEYVADDVEFTLVLPVGLSVDTTSLANECTGTIELLCAYESMAVDGSQSLTIELFTDAAGLYTVSGSVAASNDDNSSNNLDSDSVLVEDPEVQSTTDGSDDSGDTAADTTAGEGSTDALTAGADSGEGDAGNETTDGATDTATEGSTDDSTDGSTGDSTDGATDGVTDDVMATDGGGAKDSDSGAMTKWFVLLLLLLYSTRLYGRHQRQAIPIDQ